MGNKIDVHIRLGTGLNSIWAKEGKALLYTLNNQQTAYHCFSSVLCLESNREIYEHHIKGLVARFKSRENGTVFAYGQTGSGKTYTMFGGGDHDGLIQLALRDLLSGSDPLKMCLEMSFIELFNERLFDLYSGQELKMYSSQDQTNICNIHVERIWCLDGALGFLRLCEGCRKTRTTEFNSNSSRSHAILQLRKDGATLCFIDLAGSERASSVRGRLNEGSYINRSLLALGKLVNNLLNDKQLGHRDSKLTRILQPSLNSKSNLAAICTISPAKECLQESLSTLNFAARLSNLKLRAAETRETKGTDAKHVEHGAPGACEGGLGSSMSTKMVDLYRKRVESLETAVLALLEKSPDEKSLEIYILEKQMFNLNLENLKSEM